MDSHESNLKDLTEVTTGAYIFLAKILGELPLPIELPAFGQDPKVDGREALLAMERARSVVTDEPISERRKKGLATVALSWMTAYELICVSIEKGATSWRNDAIEDALLQIGIVMELVEGLEAESEDGDS